MKIIEAELVFGVVSVPVKYTGVVKATPETTFKTLHGKCLTPIQLKKWCPKCNVELFEGDTVKGVKVATHKYEAVPDDDLKAVKAERSNVVTITKFVPSQSIVDEMFYKQYHLLPDAHPDRYALLTSILVKKKMNGIGSSCLAGKERPVIIRPHLGFDTGAGLTMILAHVLEDLVIPPYVPPPLVTSKSLLGLADDLVLKMSGEIEVGDLSSESRVKREALVAEILADQGTDDIPGDLQTMLRRSIGMKRKVKG